MFFCSLDVSIQGADYGGSFFSTEDLVGPLLKIVPHRLSCTTVGWQSQDVSQQLPSPICYSDPQWFCSCDLIQFIVRYFMWPLDPNHLFLSCLLWKLSSFLWSSFHTPLVPQLCNSTLFTSVSYSRILVAGFVFQFFFQIVSSFARAIVGNSFLPWMSSQSPSFDPTFITFLHSLSSSFDHLFTVVYSQYIAVF